MRKLLKTNALASIRMLYADCSQLITRSHFDVYIKPKHILLEIFVIYMCKTKRKIKVIYSQRINKSISPIARWKFKLISQPIFYISIVAVTAFRVLGVYL